MVREILYFAGAAHGGAYAGGYADSNAKPLHGGIAKVVVDASM